MDEVLTQMNVRLSSAVTDLSGTTGLAIVHASVDGERDPHELVINASSRRIASGARPGTNPQRVTTPLGYAQGML
jgi:hypothetical protein